MAKISYIVKHYDIKILYKHNLYLSKFKKKTQLNILN